MASRGTRTTNASARVMKQGMHPAKSAKAQLELFVAIKVSTCLNNQSKIGIVHMTYAVIADSVCGLIVIKVRLFRWQLMSYSNMT